jgi:hypothetical protein
MTAQDIAKQTSPAVLAAYRRIRARQMTGYVPLLVASTQTAARAALSQARNEVAEAEREASKPKVQGW